MKLDKAQSYFKAHSASQSVLQEAYNALFMELCSEYGVDHPFQLEDEEVAQFFATLSSRWKEKKTTM